MTDRLYYYTSSCPHIKVWYGIRVYTELTKDTSYSTIYHLCMYLKLNLFVELFYIYRWEYLNKVVVDWIYQPHFWHVHRISMILFVQTRLILFCVLAYRSSEGKNNGQSPGRSWARRSPWDQTSPKSLTEHFFICNGKNIASENILATCTTTTKIMWHQRKILKEVRPGVNVIKLLQV